MAGRPRLVEAGKPLEDEREISAWEHQDSTSQDGNSGASIANTKPPQPPPASSSPQVSSLARAAGALSSTKGPPSHRSKAHSRDSFRTVIGSSHKQDNSEDDDHAMMEDSADLQTPNQPQEHFQGRHPRDSQQHSSFHPHVQPQTHHHAFHFTVGGEASAPQPSFAPENVPLHNQQMHVYQQHAHHFAVGSNSQPYSYQHVQHQERHHQLQHQPQQHQHLHHQRPSHHVEIGALPPTERMEGVVQDTSTMGPLVVMDGANLAYAYADAIGNNDSSYYSDQPARRPKLEPNVTGIEVAVRYFSQPHHNVRVLVVLPASYYRAKPRDGSSANALMETDQWEVLSRLKQEGKLVMAPPTDDDDSYVFTIGLREWDRRQQQSHTTAGAYCLSNDLYRDAQGRNPRIKEWLSNESQGRISFAFVDMGQVDDHGQRLLDIVPNPRHELVAWMEQQPPHPPQQQPYQQQYHGNPSFGQPSWPPS